MSKEEIQKWEFEQKMKVFEKALAHLPVWGAGPHIVSIVRALFGRECC